MDGTLGERHRLEEKTEQELNGLGLGVEGRVSEVDDKDLAGEGVSGAGGGET